MHISEVTFEVTNNVDWIEPFKLASDALGTTPIDITGNVIKMALKPSGGNATVLELSTNNGRILVTNAAQGAFEIRIPLATLQGLKPGDYEHDMIRISGQVTMPVWRGTLKLQKGITT